MSPKPPKPPHPKSKAQKADTSIINTNSYSIVSKRSVERLYSSTSQPAFLKPFVTKPKRRAPLINRGYWLRMRCISHVVDQFLGSTSVSKAEARSSSSDGREREWGEGTDQGKKRAKRKVVVNLGCGYDVLPFQTLWKRKEQDNQANEDQGVLFVDVDYPELMRRKTDIVRENGVFAGQLRNAQYSDAERGIMLKADEYVAVGCDLKNLTDLDEILKHELELQDSEILFMAEVSIAYMPVTAADAVIKWASTLQDCQCNCRHQYIRNVSAKYGVQPISVSSSNSSLPVQTIRSRRQC